MKRSDMENRYARMASEQNSYYNDTFRPLEDRMINYARGGLDEQTMARGLANFDNLQTNTAAMQQRQAARFGAKQYVDPTNRNALAQTAAKATATNDMRDQIEQENKALRLESLGIGTGIASNAMNTMGSVAQSLAQRKAAYEQYKQHSQNQWAGLIGSAGMAGLGYGLNTFGSKG